MKKPFILWAVLANIVLFTSCADTSSSSVSPAISWPSLLKPSKPRSFRSRRWRGRPGRSQCGPNQRKVDCPFGLCVPKTCDDVGFPIACPDLPPNATCPDGPGCVCIENYVKNKHGICIPMKLCPSCGGDKNAVSGCGTNCNKLCSQYLYKQPKCECSDDCLYNTCDCKQGFLFDEIKKKCVKPQECTKLNCQPNEEYDPCPAPCPLRTCGINDAAVDCVPALSPGNRDCAPPTCKCKNGFYRDDKGQCVTFEECPVCSGENEVYNPCPAPCPPQECGINPALVLCPISPAIGSPECKPGCVCMDGYVRNYTGNVCIKREDCPQCPENEVYDICDAPCPPRRCDVDERLIRCAAPPKPGDPNCVEGCRCADGFSRNSYGVCIPKEDCRKCEGPHETASCGSACDNECALLYKQNQTNCPIINIRCNDKCYCDEGYARDDNKICIPIEQCNTSCNGDPNAIPGCGVNCNRKCSDIGKKPGPCILICNLNGCDCKEGYYYDEAKKKCVLAKDCPQQCKKNEYYSNCTNGDCSVQDCKDLGFTISCPRINPKYCQGGCLCNEGYARNNKGICVPFNQCPTCKGDPNQVAGCGVYCNQKCSDLNNEEPELCILICYENACDCREGYYLDENTGRCVERSECPPICTENEVYSDCINGGCNAKNCSQLGKPVPCVKLDPKSCIKGCLCKTGYLRNKKGICVPEGECNPNLCPRPNEVYSSCVYDCPPRTCESISQRYNCPIMIEGNCTAQCICKPNYYRNKIGECISEANCPPICGKNEVYDPCTNGGCEFRNCSQLGGYQICIDPIKCIQGCKCKEDYLRSENGTCIPIEQCPEAKCPKNERFDKCPAALCLPQSCNDLGNEIPCSPTDGGLCPGGPGCVCNDDYVRNTKGKCIPKRQCPSCGGDPNAWSGCGVNCGKHCDDVYNKTRPCPRICYPNSCDCKDGFYYNDITGKCVKSSKCPPPCPDNEQRDLCVNGYCGIRNCSQANGPIICVDPIKCEVGCTCVDGFLRRDDTGVCVPQSECPVLPKACNTTKCTTCIDTEGPPVNETTAMENFALGNDRLNREFLYQLVVGRPGESFMFSAFSVIIALAQITLYAVGAALDQLLKLLNLNNKDEIRTVFPILIKNYQAQQSVIFQLAIKYYGSINHPFTQKFIEESAGIFQSEGQSIDFADNSQAADIINSWVANRTNNLIDNLVDESMFSEATRMVLVNALYFLGDWIYPFNPNETTPQNFYYGTNDDEVLSLPTMCQQKRFLYAESDVLDCQILQLPYKGGNYTFTIYLPRKRNGLSSMTETMRNTDNIFAQTLELLEYQTVRACIPKMDITTDISNLSQLLQMANLTVPFDPNSNSFECIFEDEESVYISDAVQKSRIKVDETGTEAAVATAITITTLSVMIPTTVYTFDFNHPGLFCLMLNDKPILCGVFTGK